MIVGMKKIYLVVQKKDAVAALDHLRDLGVIHVEHEQVPAGEGLEQARGTVSRLEKAVQILAAQDKPGPQTNARWSAHEVIAWDQTAQECVQALVRAQAQIDQLTPWGEFDPTQIQELAGQGVYVQFGQILRADLRQVPDGVAVEVLRQVGQTFWCAFVSRSPIELPFATSVLPQQSLSVLRRNHQEFKQKLEGVQQQLQQAAGSQEDFQGQLAQAQQELRFYEALGGMGESAGLSYVKGFCPTDRCGFLEQNARKYSWALWVTDPGEGREVPTLLRNPRWVQLISPLFNFMSIIPGYREADVSWSFLLFFSIFFGILVGDAGYGLIFFLLTFAVQRKTKQAKKYPEPFFLMYLLSSFAMGWGLLTGTFFGQTLFGAFIQPLVPWLNNDKNMQGLCFTIGLAHLGLAHVWRGVRKWPSPAALSEIGWIALLVAGYLFAGKIILERPLPQITRYLLYVGAAFVIFFNQPQKNILKGLGMGLGDLLLSAMNMFMDLVSYIRLFAVGAAGVALAESFNAMALNLGFHSVFAGLGAALILVVGHLLNIVLSVMAVLVHGLRLNILEFSSHLGLEWSGVPYAPLKREVETTA